MNTVNSNKIINNKNNLCSGRSSKIQKVILSQKEINNNIQAILSEIEQQKTKLKEEVKVVSKRPKTTANKNLSSS